MGEFGGYYWILGTLVSRIFNPNLLHILSLSLSLSLSVCVGGYVYVYVHARIAFFRYFLHEKIYNELYIAIRVLLSINLYPTRPNCIYLGTLY